MATFWAEYAALLGKIFGFYLIFVALAWLCWCASVFGPMLYDSCRRPQRPPDQPEVEEVELQEMDFNVRRVRIVDPDSGVET